MQLSVDGFLVLHQMLVWKVDKILIANIIEVSFVHL